MCKPDTPDIHVPEPKQRTPNYLRNRFLDGIMTRTIEMQRGRMGARALTIRKGGAAPTAGFPEPEPTYQPRNRPLGQSAALTGNRWQPGGRGLTIR